MRACHMDLRLVGKVLTDSHLNLWLGFSGIKNCIEILYEGLAENENLLGEVSHLRVHVVDAKQAIFLALANVAR